MPLLRIQTNSPVDPAASQALAAAASALVSEMLGKPEHYVMVSVEHTGAMLFDASPAPLAYLELKSIGLPAERTTAFSAALCGLLDEHLGIPAARIYIEFADVARHLWGWDGATF